MKRNKHALEVKYPDLFADVIKFELPPGWEGLVDSLCAQLMNLEDLPSIEFVKEKFGGLRVYCTNTKEPADFEFPMYPFPHRLKDLVRNAENASWFICQDCGSTRTVGIRHISTKYGGFIIKTSCDTCYEKALNE